TRAREHRRRGVDADDGVAVAHQRHERAARAAAELQDGAARVGRAQLARGQLAVPADVVAAALVLVVVEGGVFIVFAGAGGQRGSQTIAEAQWCVRSLTLAHGCTLLTFAR